MENFSSALLTHQNRLSLTQKELADLCDVAPKTIYNALHGPISAGIERKIAEKLGFPSPRHMMASALLTDALPADTGLRIIKPVHGDDTIPVFDSVAAGWEGDIHDPQDVGADNGVSNKQFPRWMVGTTDPKAFGVIVHGDSMAPDFPHGAIVFCSPAADQKEGDDCVMRLDDGSAFLRRIFAVEGEPDMLTLHPLNAKYKPKTVARETILVMSKVIKTLK